MNFLHCLDLVGVQYSHLPLSLPTLAAVTPPGIETVLIDENVEAVPLETDAEIVAITGSIPQRKRFFELADAFRKKGKLVAVGGPITFDMLEECKAHADVVFVGEGEYTWPAFLADYRTGSHKAVYVQKEFINIDDSPVPAFHLLRPGAYASGCIQVTRGCPCRCDFCDIPVKYGGVPRSKAIGQVLQEIRALAALGHDSIFVVDDNFAANRAHTKELLKAIAGLLPTLPNKMYFYTQATLDVANDEELLGLLRDAAFLRLFIGIETGDNGKLRELHKRHQVGMDIRRAVEKIKSYGITVWAGIMFGLENDDLASFDQQFEFIRDTDFIPVQVGLLQAVPDTPLYRRAVEEHRLIKMPSIIGLTALSEAEVEKATNLLPTRMTERELEQNYACVLRKMFAPEVYGAKLISYIGADARPMLSSKLALNGKSVMVLLRTVLFYLLHADRQTRRMFFRVSWTLLKRGLRNVDETVFHLLAYKHIQAHYYKIAEICEAGR
jgi:radical SAM superfamily enzyme YgiQ (UPF0313 family)